VSFHVFQGADARQKLALFAAVLSVHIKRIGNAGQQSRDNADDDADLVEGEGGADGKHAGGEAGDFRG